MYDEIQRTQARTVGSFHDKRILKPQMHQVWGRLVALKEKLQYLTTNLDPVTEALLKTETDGHWGHTVEHRQSLENVHTSAVAKSKKK